MLGLYPLLQPRGLGWIAMGVALLVVVAGSFWDAWRARRGVDAKAATWANAALDPVTRGEAIVEMRRMLGEMSAKGAISKAQASEHTRLAVLLSDWLAIDGKGEQAAVLLDSLDVSAMPADDAAAVTHGRALLLLRSGDAAKAREVLDDRPARIEDEGLAMRLDLLEAAAQVELGEGDAALATANDIARRARGDAGLLLEARVLRASVLDAQGSKAEAAEILRELGADVRRMIAVVGLPRVRTLVSGVAS